MRGLSTSQEFGYTLRSDLLPGFDVQMGYSLFDGSTLSDTAKFSPYRENITSAFSFSNTANPFAVFTRLFGRAVPPSAPSTDVLNPPPDDRYARQVASQPVAGQDARTAAFLPTLTKGWQASFTFTAARQRPITGTNVVQFDPTTVCSSLNTALLRLQYDQCIANARANPPVQTPITSGLSGSTIYLAPPTTSLGANLNFNLTQHWAASWQTQYDFVQHNFASQIVLLQRDLHDWRAIFALHAVAEWKLRVQLPDLAESGAGFEVRLSAKPPTGTKGSRAVQALGVGADVLLSARFGGCAAEAAGPVCASPL